METIYEVVKNMAASSIFACLPQEIIKGENLQVDDWNSAIFALREWKKYTESLEKKVESFEGRRL